jgi:hypothetical protein
MLDSTINNYGFNVIIENEMAIISMDGFSEHAMKLDRESGEVLSWSIDDNGDLVIHYLSKGDHLKNFPSSLIEDLKSGNAFLVVGRGKGEALYIIQKRK